MNRVNYAAMSDRELRQYFLRHRQDKQALRAYLDRLADRPLHIITTVEYPEFEVKIEAAVMAQMQEENKNGETTI
ncbi:MAG: hypothetical protein F6J93_04025 [Oscillatoria sp. SIO1A7]|nr:hypothetical protein [Oscillatoria sp. SIO1A7]